MDSTSGRRRRPLLSIAVATALLVGAGTAANIAAGTLPAASAQDQPATGAPPAGHARGQMMAKALMSLDLTDAQKSQIRAIRDETMKANADVTDRDVRRANYKAMMAKVETVLTPAQRTQFHAKLDAMRAQYQAQNHS
jgi:Spy/CpxP family protein refolding chaperone